MAPTVSGHVCIAAQLTATDDAVRDVSLQGVPVSQSDAQALIRRDNNKAQLNLEVVFVSPRMHRGKYPFESYAVVDFGRTAVRIVEPTLQVRVDGGAAEFTSPVEVSLLDSALEPVTVLAPSRANRPVTLRDLRPTGAQWVRLQLPAFDGELDDEVTVNVAQQVRGGTMGGFSARVQVATDLDVLRQRLGEVVRVLHRAAAIGVGKIPAKRQRKAERELRRGREDVAPYVIRLGKLAPRLADIAESVGGGSRIDRFGLVAGAAAVRAEIEAGDAEGIVGSSAVLTARLDAALTDAYRIRSRTAAEKDTSSA